MILLMNLLTLPMNLAPDSSDEEGPGDGPDEDSSDEDATGPVKYGTSRWLAQRVVGRSTSMGKPAGDEHRKGTVLYRVLWRECNDSHLRPHGSPSHA